MFFSPGMGLIMRRVRTRLRFRAWFRARRCFRRGRVLENDTPWLLENDSPWLLVNDSPLKKLQCRRAGEQ